MNTINALKTSYRAPSTMGEYVGILQSQKTAFPLISVTANICHTLTTEDLILYFDFYITNIITTIEKLTVKIKLKIISKSFTVFIPQDMSAIFIILGRKEEYAHEIHRMPQSGVQF